MNASYSATKAHVAGMLAQEIGNQPLSVRALKMGIPTTGPYKKSRIIGWTSLASRSLEVQFEVWGGIIV